MLNEEMITITDDGSMFKGADISDMLSTDNSHNDQINKVGKKLGDIISPKTIYTVSHEPVIEGDEDEEFPFNFDIDTQSENKKTKIKLIDIPKEIRA